MKRNYKKINRTHITIVNQGVDYIVDHLYEKITVEMIADHCCFSRHYFNRLFKSITGESIYSFIKRLRIETAAFKLVKFPHQRITQLAAELGYSSSNFSVLFKEYYGMSPSQFRSNPNLPENQGIKDGLKKIQTLQKNKPVALLRKMDRQITFETLPKTRLVYERYMGNYENLASVWKKFCAKIERSSSGGRIEYYGISYDDPMIAGENNCLYDLCAKTKILSGLENRNYRTLGAGDYLCYRFDDHVSRLKSAYNNLFGVWMPHRAYVMGPGLCFEKYRSGLSPEGRLSLDICVPVV